MPRLPPGPRSTLLATWQLMMDPFTHYPRWRETYGDPFTVRAINGVVVMTGEPEHIRDVFKAPPGFFDVFGAEAGRVIAGPSSILISEGDKHVRDRKLLMPPFHGDRMRAYGEIMQASAVRHIENTIAAGDVVTGYDLSQRVSLEVTLRAVFGIDDDDELAVVRDALNETMAAVHPSVLFAPALQREGMGLLPFAKFKRAFERADDLLQQRLDELRPQAADREDILSLLLLARYDDGEPMPDEEVKDQLRTLLIAGHETSAITLAWTLYELCRHPELLARAREEADAAADHGELVRAPLLTAVIKEVLRLHPILVEVIRKLRSDWQVGEYLVPAGAHIAPCILLAHQNPAIYDDPLAFRPDRFIDRTYGPFEYMPFGGGDRRCIGAAFAEYEMRIALGTWLQRADIELLDDAPLKAVRQNLVMGPEGGVKLRVSRRQLARSAA